MRDWLNIFEDTGAENIITFEQLQKLFRTKYNIDLHDVNDSHDAFERWLKKHQLKKATDAVGQQQQWASYDEAPDGRRMEKPYFNFWHWLLAKSKHVKFTTTSTEHWKVIAFSQLANTPPTEEDLALKARVMNKYKDAGVAAPNISDGYHEAGDILEKIFKEFGPNVELLMHVSR